MTVEYRTFSIEASRNFTEQWTARYFRKVRHVFGVRIEQGKIEPQPSWKAAIEAAKNAIDAHLLASVPEDEIRPLLSPW